MKIINNIKIFLKNRINNISLNINKKIIYFIIILMIISFLKESHRIYLENKPDILNIHNIPNIPDKPDISDILKKNIKKVNKKESSLKDHTFKLTVNSATCSIPLFNLRTYKDLDFYFNFIIHNFNNEKINNLIMVKDIQKWMSSASITDEDLNDECVPIYFIKKNKDNNDIKTYEYLKVFIQTDINNIKNAFVSKGTDYTSILTDIEILINKHLIKDLLDTKEYNNYNLSKSNSINDFLDRFLSFILVSEILIGEDIILDLKYHNEIKKQYYHFFNIINSDCVHFNTTL